MYVIKFQKQGLPHVCMLLILESNDKLRDPNSLVRVEIPKIEEESQLHDVVLKYMVHGTCRTLNPKSPSMKNSQCKKNYPKQFLEEICQGNDSHLEYRRRFDQPKAY